MDKLCALKNIHIILLQSNEVPSSYWCEIEGLKRIIEELGDDRISILVTVRHRYFMTTCVSMKVCLILECNLVLQYPLIFYLCFAMTD